MIERTQLREELRRVRYGVIKDRLKQMLVMGVLCV